MLLIIITALIPALILGWWIYRKDSVRPEPLRMLIQAFLYGVGSTFVTLVITQLLGIVGLFTGILRLIGLLLVRLAHRGLGLLFRRVHWSCLYRGFLNGVLQRLARGDRFGRSYPHVHIGHFIQAL